MHSIIDLVRDLLIFVVVMFARLIALIVVVSRLADENPLKRILSRLTHRIGATVGAGLVAVPTEPLRGLVAVPLAIVWYWFTFQRDSVRMMRAPKPSE